MKCVYVLISSGEDNYIEQAIISAFSLKYYNPDIYLSILTDDRTKLLINKTSLIEYVNEIIDVKIPSHYNLKERSRFLKTSLTDYILDDFIFIDTDTIICDRLDELFDILKNNNICAVADKHVVISEHSFKDDILYLANKLEWKIRLEKVYFNSGVLTVKNNDITKQFFTTWHKLWKEGLKFNISSDQASLAKADEISGYIIHEISGIYNCQFLENGLKYFYKAKILHYFASNIGVGYTPPFIFRDTKIFQEIKKNGLTKNIKEQIIDAKTAFYNQSLVVDEEFIKTMRTPIVRLSVKLTQNFPNLNKLLYKLSRTLKNKM